MGKSSKVVLSSALVVLSCASFAAAAEAASAQLSSTAIESQAPATVETPAAPAPAALDASQVKGIVGEYIEKDTKLKGGEFLFYDSTAKKAWKLKLAKIHDDVRSQDMNLAEVCVDLTSGKGREKAVLDMDFFVIKNLSGNLEVTDIRIHKVGKKERYIYDENNQIRPAPVKPRKSVRKKTTKPAVPGIPK